MGRKKPPGSKRKGPTLSVQVATPGNLPDAFQRVAEADVLFFVGASWQSIAVKWCFDFLEVDRAAFHPEPKPEGFSLFATGDAELDEVGAVCILAHGLHPNHVGALRKAIQRVPDAPLWGVWVPEDIDPQHARPATA